MSRRIGANGRDTKERILEVAKNEFKSLGYKGASLRLIASSANVTTGALYFFFENKDSLFKAVIGEALDPFITFIAKHYEEERGMNISSSMDNDLDAVDFIYDFYLAKRDIWTIIFDNIDIDVVREYLNEFIDMSVTHYKYLIEAHERLDNKKYNIDEFTIRMFISMQISTIAHTLLNNKDEELLKKHLREAIIMLRGAYFSLIS